MHCTVLRGSVDLHPMPPEAVLYQLDFTKLYILGPAPAHTYDGTAGSKLWSAPFKISNPVRRTASYTFFSDCCCIASNICLCDHIHLSSI
uniref:Uncharacterized protein n=1 Tax=Hyaloperonospora arabidopsidis (strain Emoy2) TaxID=559515 RepID=M4BPK2_HYAAE